MTAEQRSAIVERFVAATDANFAEDTSGIAFMCPAAVWNDDPYAPEAQPDCTCVENAKAIRDELIRLRRIEAKAREIAAGDAGLLSTVIAARYTARKILAAGTNP